MLLCFCCASLYADSSEVVSVSTNASEPPTLKKKATIAIITGGDEYNSGEIMKPFAQKLKDYGFKVILIHDSAPGINTDKEHDPKPTVLQGAEQIKEADLLIVFMRFRNWETKSLKLFMDHFNSGKPALGIRTTTHGFWKDRTFAPKNFGGHYKTHKHRLTVAQVNPQYSEHPILRGVDRKFAEHEGPYLSTPLTEGAEPLVLSYGSREKRTPKKNKDFDKIIGLDSYDSPTAPIVWTFKHKGARRAMITPMSYRAGTQDSKWAQNLFYNSVFWTLGYEVPEGGVLSKGKALVITRENKVYSAPNQTYPEVPSYSLPQGWTTLFDGQDLKQWKHYDYLTSKPGLIRIDARAASSNAEDYNKTGARWKIENSAVIARPGYGDIMSAKSYKNYKLRLNFLVPEEPEWVKNEWKGNSGVYIHGSFEIAIHNSFGLTATKRTNGAIYRQVAPTSEASKKSGQWQTLEITCMNNTLTVKLNAKVIHDKILLKKKTLYGFPASQRGPIRLQSDRASL